jgi:hypothetical protein
VLDMIAGGLILAWPSLGRATLAVIIGIVLIIRGILFIAAGWEMPGSTPHSTAPHPGSSSLSLTQVLPLAFVMIAGAADSQRDLPCHE